MSELASRHCQPCEGGAAPLSPEEMAPLRAQLDPPWEIVRGHHLERVYRFEDFRAALDYVQRVGEMAEEEFHHPDVELSWGRVGIRIWTHKIDGLHEADFVFAAKCDALFRQP